MPEPLRKDAARNRERIVAVARALVDAGSTLHLNDVARRAGLGVGTVYRHFPSAEALLETVATPCLEDLTVHATDALTDPDPVNGLRTFLTRTVEAQLTEAALPPVAAAAEDALPRTTELKRALMSTSAALFACADDTGALDTDLTAADLVPLVCGIAYAAKLHGDDPDAQIAAARRYLATVLAGLRANPGETTKPAS